MVNDEELQVTLFLHFWTFCVSSFLIPKDTRKQCSRPRYIVSYDGEDCLLALAALVDLRFFLDCGLLARIIIKIFEIDVMSLFLSSELLFVFINFAVDLLSKFLIVEVSSSFMGELCQLSQQAVPSCTPTQIQNELHCYDAASDANKYNTPINIS